MVHGLRKTMPKLIIRCVTILLVPCLVADPISANVLSAFSIPSKPTTPTLNQTNCFETEALIERLVDVTHKIGGQPVIGSLYRRLKPAAAAPGGRVRNPKSVLAIVLVATVSALLGTWAAHFGPLRLAITAPASVGVLDYASLAVWGAIYLLGRRGRSSSCPSKTRALLASAA